MKIGDIVMKTYLKKGDPYKYGIYICSLSQKTIALLHKNGERRINDKKDKELKVVGFVDFVGAIKKSELDEALHTSKSRVVLGANRKKMR